MRILMQVATCILGGFLALGAQETPESTAGKYGAIGSAGSIAGGALEQDQSAPCASVPSNYLSLCTELLNADLLPFETTYLSNVTLPGTIVTQFGGQINPGESSVGPGLLTSNNEAAVYQWLSMQNALGATQVTVHVDFPMLDPDFYWNSSQTPAQQASGQAQLLQIQTYYKNLAVWVRSFGLKLVVQTQNLFPSATTINSAPVALWGGLNGVATMKNFYNGMYQANTGSPNYSAYSMDRGTQAAWIAANMTPDYLSVIYEPDSEATNAGMPALGTVPGSLANLQGIMASYYSANPPATQVGAGVGVWIFYYDAVANISYNALSFDQAYASTPGTTDGANPLGLNFIDMHLYDITNNGKNNFLTMAWSVAQWVSQSTSLQLGMSEMWLAKASAADVTSGNGLPTYRNTYSFWAPLDTRFLADMYAFTAYWGFVFDTVSYPQFFSAYITYANAPPNNIVTWDTQTPPNAASINAASATATTAALNSAQDTPTGLAYYQMLVPSDATAPSAPRSFKATPATGMVYLTWQPATDGTGTFAYLIARTGLLSPIRETTWFVSLGVPELFYQDTNVKSKTTYTYSVTAVDLAGNSSQPVTATVTPN